ncbi:MAG: hypothetical protein GY796_16710 [Chloroflexi bacterium]|nr:hypothetical protein [Chloroflexota bacterium]
MTEESPTLEEWRPLYTAVNQIKKLAPWEWMDEDDLFGVQDPETGKLGFVSVMGGLGEHYSIGVYLGAEGLYRFWEMQEQGPFIEPEFLLNTPQLQASFENRNDLSKKDRDVIKALKLKYRGRQAWPQFQSYAPGLAPWYLTAAETQFLGHILEQTLDVAPRFEDNPELLEVDDELKYLIRVPHQEKGKLVWRDEIRPILPPSPKEYRLPMDPQAMAHLDDLPQTTAILDVDFFWMPTPVKDEEERPYFPYNFLIMEASSGMILGTDMMIANPSADEMWSSLPMKLVQTLARINIKPKTIRVVSPPLASFLEPLTERYEMELQLVDDLPNLENMKASLMDFMEHS